MAEYITPSQPENYLTVMTILNHPFSRGSIHISSSDVSSLPVWDPAYNTNPLDMELFARSLQFVDKIVAPTSAFGSLLKPSGKRIPDIRADDFEQAREIVRQRQISVFHVAGSCAMLPRDKGGVVDNRLRVYGVKGLRVVDASVFPLEPSGNLQSTVYAVAERAADILKEDRAV
jgi:choline dehydrogenase-like flavoprotein